MDRFSANAFVCGQTVCNARTNVLEKGQYNYKWVGKRKKRTQVDNAQTLNLRKEMLNKDDEILDVHTKPVTGTMSCEKGGNSSGSVIKRVQIKLPHISGLSRHCKMLFIKVHR